MKATERAFAAVLSSGSVVTWGDADYGGDSEHVQVPFQRRSECRVCLRILARRRRCDKVVGQASHVCMYMCLKRHLLQNKMSVLLYLLKRSIPESAMQKVVQCEILPVIAVIPDCVILVVVIESVAGAAP